MKTALFFIYSILLFLSFWFSGYNYSKLSVIIPYIIYIIFLIWVFKDIKIRFLAYPLIILNFSFGLFYYEAAGLGTENAVGVGYVFMYLFMFIAIPIMLIALIIGSVLDIIEFIRNRKQ